MDYSLLVTLGFLWLSSATAHVVQSKKHILEDIRRTKIFSSYVRGVSGAGCFRTSPYRSTGTPSPPSRGVVTLSGQTPASTTSPSPVATSPATPSPVSTVLVQRLLAQYLLISPASLCLVSISLASPSAVSPGLAFQPFLA